MNGRVGDVHFVDRAAGDYRLARASAALARPLYVRLENGDTATFAGQAGDPILARPVGMRYPTAGMDSVILQNENEPVE